MVITEDVKVLDKVLASGGPADIRTGTYLGHRLAVKTLKVADTGGSLKIRKMRVNDIFSAAWNVFLTALLQQFCKVILWNMLSHPNILKLINVQGDMDKEQFTTVLEWMAHGNIMEYIRKN